MAAASEPNTAIGLACWQRIFAVDFRSLAALRVALGVLVLLDVRLRWPVIREMYSDDGFFTRALSNQYFDANANMPWRDWIWSVHMLDGSLEWAHWLFAIEAILAVLLIAGCLTRMVTLLLWILVASVHVRCPIIISSADMYLKLMLFWSILLPLGRVWSIDSLVLRRPRSAGFYCSAASAAFILQLILMYFFTGIAKCNDVWLGGTAMEYVMRLDIYATPLGMSLLEIPFLPGFINWSTLVMELGAIWLVLVPWRNGTWRVLLILTFWLFHFGIALSMSIGLFSWICMAAWLIVVPAGFWNWLGREAPLPHQIDKLPERPVMSRSFGLAFNAFACLMILLSLLWNICNLDYPRYAWVMPPGMEWLGRVTAFEQHFQMFGKPPPESPWFVYRGTLKNGQEVDIFRGGTPVDMEKPKRIAQTFPDHNYRKLHRNLIAERLKDYRQPLLESVTRDWNSRHAADEQVLSAELIAIYETIGPKYNGVDRMTQTWATWKSPELRDGWRFDRLRQQLQNRNGPIF